MSWYGSPRHMSRSDVRRIFPKACNMCCYFLGSQCHSDTPFRFDQPDPRCGRCGLHKQLALETIRKFYRGDFDKPATWRDWFRMWRRAGGNKRGEMRSRKSTRLAADLY